MREQWARRIAFLTALLVALQAAAFAWYLNRPAAGSPTTGAGSAAVAAAAPRERIERGRDLFETLRCGDCHALAGLGKRAGAPDGAAAAVDAASTREWIVAGPSVERRLPRRALARKQAYRDLSAEDLEALVVFLNQTDD